MLKTPKSVMNTYEKNVLGYIRFSIRKQGHSPTLQSISNYCGITVAMANIVLASLKRKGLIERKKYSRDYSLVENAGDKTSDVFRLHRSRGISVGVR